MQAARTPPARKAPIQAVERCCPKLQAVTCGLMPWSIMNSELSEQHQYKNDKKKKADAAIQPVAEPISWASTEAGEAA
jgi:hypothetical protein